MKSVKYNHETMFKLVLNLISNNLTITESLYTLRINGTLFYNTISEIDKQELRIARALCSDGYDHKF